MKNKIKTIDALGFAIANLILAQRDFAANPVTVSYHTVGVGEQRSGKPV